MESAQIFPIKFLVLLDVIIGLPFIKEDSNTNVIHAARILYETVEFPATELSQKLKLYRSVIRPKVTYASETWVLKESSIKKLLIFERKILRKIFGSTREKTVMEN